MKAFVFTREEHFEVEKMNQLNYRMETEAVMSVNLLFRSFENADQLQSFLLF
jgi:hypothetical protein